MTHPDTDRLVSIVPQDKSAGIFRGTLGLSPDEALLVILIPTALAMGILEQTGYTLGWVAPKWAAAVLLLGFIARKTPSDHTPYSLF